MRKYPPYLYRSVTPPPHRLLNGVQNGAFGTPQAWASTQAHGGDKLGDAESAAVSITARAGHTRAWYWMSCSNSAASSGVRVRRVWLIACTRSAVEASSGSGPADGRDRDSAWSIGR